MKKKRNNSNKKSQAGSGDNLIYKFLNKYKFFIIFLILAIIMYGYLYSALNQTIMHNSHWDSYTLQANAWLSGQTHLGQDYPWLELAYYQDKVYLSFPPFPTVPMFFLAIFFGEETPSSLVTSLYAILAFLAIYMLCKRWKLSDFSAVMWAVFLAFGSNLISVSVMGGVWYQAQSLNFALTCFSIFFITSDKKAHWYLALALWAMAVGCRPFQIVYFPVYMYIVYQKLKKEGFDTKFFLKVLVKLSIIPAFIGFSYAAYNFIRFGNPLDFGRQYLLEYVNEPDGQFNINYFLNNWGNIFRLPLNENYKIQFPKFNGFAFYLANPFYIVFLFSFFTSIFMALRKKIKLNMFDLLIPGTILLHFLVTLSHRTLGGWQFGLRYFIDMLPMAFLYVLIKGSKINNFKKYEIPVTVSIIPLIVFSVALNIYGTLWLFLEW
ncbi:hypothetical protein RBH29_00090 [Herbivorax sp. ANBcel31]|uniref:hypothetical protein n=1 Tax=Herbivorax sp. ANBcel31 TaxID=3069754 RepID=UPI0027B1695C|nr:hypothetical protein [Herbivorax sp. ANBcel31]MDQ2084834.1 hypothetical protein [Herbivorax sp. ANBcel31]